MDGTFCGTFEDKLHDLYTNEAKSEYILQCLPYIQQYCSEAPEEEVVEESLFNTKITKGIQRKEIFKEYMKNVEGFKGQFREDKPKETRHLEEICKRCNSTNLYKNTFRSEYVCMDCGCCDWYLGEELSYKEEQENIEKTVNSGYKKENHLNEWILQFQGRETTNIPQDVLDKLRAEFKKERIKDVSEISKDKVKKFLKKLKLTKYYEHSTYITHILNGLTPPVMSQELEDRLRLMFREVQDPFKKHCPPDRNNFLSYSYVLYKFCELLDEDDYLPYFPLLKAKDKLRQQDVIWKNICKELQWEYIPTA